MMTTLRQDIRYGLRTLRRAPGFTAVAIASLAIGIGLNSTLFAVVDTLLFKPLPYERPDRVVAIFTSDGSEAPFGTTSYPDLQDIARSATAFDGVVGHSMMFGAVRIAGENRLIFGEIVTGTFFSTLGIPLAAGRGFDADHDNGEGAHSVALISERLWARSFGRRPDTIGQTLTIKDSPYTIIGVVAAGYTGSTPGIAADVWVPAMMVDDVEPAGQISVVPSPSGTTRLTQRGQRWLFVKARLRDDVSLSQAQAEVDTITRGLEAAFPVSNRHRLGTVLPAESVRFHPDLDGYIRPAGLVLMGAVGLVLLIACANLAGMLLARGATRTKEMALRAAIGAGRMRLIRQMVVEHMVLSTLGGGAGLLLAFWATSWIAAARLPLELPISLVMAMDWRVVAYTAGLSLLTGLTVGVLPALKASRPDLVASLKDDATMATHGRGFGLRHVLVVVQVSVSVVLLVGGALMVRSLMAGARMSPGFAMDGLVAATVSLDMHGYDVARSRVFFEQAEQRVRRLPGVTTVSLAERLPFSPNMHMTTVFIEGRPEATSPDGATVDTSRVTADYFRTLDVPILRGRDFDTRDTPESGNVAIISETFARTFFPDEDPLGRHVRLRAIDGPRVEIVGISKDYTIRQVGETPRPVIHYAASQRASTTYSLLARTSADAAVLVSGIERELRALEPNVIFLELGTVSRMAATSMLPITIGATVFAGLGGLAMMLAGIGLYGVIAFSVSRRTREIGIRMALGSSRRLVVVRILREALILVGIGTVIGGVLASAVAGVLSVVLLDVTSSDPVSYLAAVAALLSVTAVAAILPARRAASVDPLVALRTL